VCEACCLFCLRVDAVLIYGVEEVFIGQSLRGG
jgi:hypothetical protein